MDGNANRISRPSGVSDGRAVMPLSADDFTGYVACLVSSFMFGSNFVPVKRVYTGNGMFFTLPLVLWVFGPLWLVLGNLALVAGLRLLDWGEFEYICIYMFICMFICISI